MGTLINHLKLLYTQVEEITPNMFAVIERNNQPSIYVHPVYQDRSLILLLCFIISSK